MNVYNHLLQIMLIFLSVLSFATLKAGEDFPPVHIDVTALSSVPESVQKSAYLQDSPIQPTLSLSA